MTIYQRLATVGPRFIAKHTLLKWGFNLVPMYRRTTARIVEVSEDIRFIRIRLPISYKNKNYVGSIFGGSMFAAVDPIPMVQLINLLDSRYVVWDKSATVKFRAPARVDLFADFSWTQEELDLIETNVRANGEHNIEKITMLTDGDRQTTYCEVRKTLYIATKEHYRSKSGARQRTARA